MARPAGRWLRGPAAFVLLLTGGSGLVMGLANVANAASLADQIYGAAYVVAGVIATTGAVAALTPSAWLTARQTPVGAGFRSTPVAIGFLAGLYITATLALFSSAYSPDKMLLFIAFACICVVGLGLLALRGDLGNIGFAGKAVGLSLGVVLSAAQLWYQSIYLPENTEVGLQIALALEPTKITAGRTHFAHLHLTVENRSSDAAVVLTSMVTITGVKYVPSPGAGSLSNKATQSREVQEGTEANPPDGMDVRYRAKAHHAVLAVDRVIDDGSKLVSDNAYSRNLLVAIPDSGYQELDATIQIDYARVTRLSLGSDRRLPPRTERSCNHDVRSVWSINQSPLRRFTRGREILITNWCADLGSEHIYSFVSTPGQPLTEKVKLRNDRVYGNQAAKRVETFPLS
jgi:hypothetical protein